MIRRQRKTRRKEETEGKERLPSVSNDSGVLARMGGTGIPPSGGTPKGAHGKPISVSVYDQNSNLVREFAHLRDVFHHYRRNGEKRIKDLQISGAEKEQLLYRILSMKKKQGNRVEG